jgi:hypothetical protein
MWQRALRSKPNTDCDRGVSLPGLSETVSKRFQYHDVDSTRHFLADSCCIEEVREADRKRRFGALLFWSEVWQSRVSREPGAAGHIQAQARRTG